MNDDIYLEKAMRTAADPGVFKKRLKVKPMNGLMKYIKDFQEISNTLDQYKKGLIYGKDVEILKGYPDSQEVAIGAKYANLIHGILGIMTEAGELSENLTKGLDFDIVNIKEEIGDLLWFIALICDTYSLDMDEIKRINIAKLAARYPNLFTEQDAINRNLENERQVLEK